MKQLRQVAEEVIQAMKKDEEGYPPDVRLFFMTTVSGRLEGLDGAVFSSMQTSVAGTCLRLLLEKRSAIGYAVLDVGGNVAIFAQNKGLAPPIGQVKLSGFHVIRWYIPSHFGEECRGFREDPAGGHGQGQIRAHSTFTFCPCFRSSNASDKAEEDTIRGLDRSAHSGLAFDASWTIRSREKEKPTAG